MSTRISIAWSGREEETTKNHQWHFYAECLDHRSVYLEQSGQVFFEANNQRVLISIPAEVMDRLAQAWVEEGRKLVKTQEWKDDPEQNS